MPYEIELLWKTDDPEEAAALLNELGQPAVSQIADSLIDAVQGRASAVNVYVRSWRLLTKTLLRELAEVRPDLVLEENGIFLIVDIKKKKSSIVQQVLETSAINAPFSPWVTLMEPHLGAASYLVSELRKYTPGFHPIPLDENVTAFPHWGIDQQGFARFARRVWVALEQDRSPIERIAQAFELSDTEMGRLFGVSRQAIAQWVEQGIPTARLPKVLSVLSIVDDLERNLRPEIVAGVARQPAPLFKNKTILQMIEADKHLNTADAISRSFDWATTA